MQKLLSQVKGFHIASNSHLEEAPTASVPKEIKESRIRLIREEATEVLEALEHEPIDHIAKELADLLYVTLGTVHAYGLGEKFEKVFDAVHDSNMRKLQGGAKLNAQGKVVKGANYTKPDIKKILEW